MSSEFGQYSIKIKFSENQDPLLKLLLLAEKKNKIQIEYEQNYATNRRISQVLNDETLDINSYISEIQQNNQDRIDRNQSVGTSQPQPHLAEPTRQNETTQLINCPVERRRMNGTYDISKVYLSKISNFLILNYLQYKEKLKLIYFGPTLEDKMHTDCSICLTDYSDSDRIVMFDCYHIIHEDCLKHSPRPIDKCPNCRKNLFTL